MPTYVFKCRACEHSHDEQRQISQRDEAATCPLCESRSERDVVASMRVNSTDQEYSQPIYSNALGVPVNQIDQAKKTFPHHEFTPDGRMVLRSHAQRNRVMKDLGFFDRDSFY